MLVLIVVKMTQDREVSNMVYIETLKKIVYLVSNIDVCSCIRGQWEVQTPSASRKFLRDPETYDLMTFVISAIRLFNWVPENG
jgi:hypothetical protein